MDQLRKAGMNVDLQVMDPPTSSRRMLSRFCHVSRRLQRVARPEFSDHAICMMPIAMRA